LTEPASSSLLLICAARRPARPHPQAPLRDARVRAEVPPIIDSLLQRELLPETVASAAGQGGDGSEGERGLCLAPSGLKDPQGM
jgi:hypothetical protein